jgi:glycosyltransferase involved in cell wall biosynthesis
VHGYFPEKNSLSELVKYVNLVFKDLNLSEQMGRRAWDIAKDYTWINYSKRLDNIIKKYI